MKRDAFPSPIKAFAGSVLTVAGGGLADVPILALIGIPLLVLGATLNVQGALAPLDDPHEERGSLLSHFFLVCGALAIVSACIATAAEIGAQFVAAKRGQVPQVNWVMLLGYWLAAPALLTLGNRLRAREPAPAILARVTYWFLHFPAVALIVLMLGRSGTPLAT